MNKFVTSALALSVAGSLAHAGTSDGEWLELDREIASLATPVTSPAQGGINWSALIRVNEYYSGDFPSAGGETPSGVGFQDIDLAATGQVGDYTWRISVGINGSFEDMLMYSLSVMNGANGVYADHAYLARLEYNLGEGAGNAEGALGAGDDLAATIGVSYANFDDLSGTGGDDAIYAIDFWGTAGQIGFGAEWANIDKGIMGGTDEDFFAGLTGITFDADSNPYDVTGSFLINEEMEVAVRYEDSDNGDGVTALSLGFNWYQSGHNAKWQVSLTDISSDVSADEGTIWSAGLSLGSSGS
jgi:hypothetical protein